MYISIIYSLSQPIMHFLTANRRIIGKLYVMALWEHFELAWFWYFSIMSRFQVRLSRNHW